MFSDKGFGYLQQRGGGHTQKLSSSDAAASVSTTGAPKCEGEGD